jgi:hypothetical protein
MQSQINNFFSVCNAAETSEGNGSDVSESPINNLSEHSSSTNSEALSHTGHSKTPLTPSKMLNKICPVLHNPVKETTKKQPSAVLKSSEFTENKS